MKIIRYIFQKNNITYIFFKQVEIKAEQKNEILLKIKYNIPDDLEEGDSIDVSFTFKESEKGDIIPPIPPIKPKGEVTLA